MELQCHGGRAVIAAVETALAALPGLRRAKPGEFTRRAFINGKIDLAEAEGLADLLEAETELQRLSAMAMAGVPFPVKWRLGAKNYYPCPQRLKRFWTLKTRMTLPLSRPISR